MVAVEVLRDEDTRTMEKDCVPFILQIFLFLRRECSVGWEIVNRYVALDATGVGILGFGCLLRADLSEGV